MNSIHRTSIYHREIIKCVIPYYVHSSTLWYELELKHCTIKGQDWCYRKPLTAHTLLYANYRRILDCQISLYNSGAKLLYIRILVITSNMHINLSVPCLSSIFYFGILYFVQIEFKSPRNIYTSILIFLFQKSKKTKKSYSN